MVVFVMSSTAKDSRGGIRQTLTLSCNIDNFIKALGLIEGFEKKYSGKGFEVKNRTELCCF